MQGLAGRDAAALGELYDRHAPLLYGLILRMVRVEADAQGVLSDVFVEVWENPHRFNPQRGPARTYLAMLARCRAVDYLRSQRRRTVHEALAAEHAAHDADAGDEGDPAEAVADAEQHGRVRQALAGLGARHRACLEGAYFGGLTHREIAEQLGLPLGTVKTRIRQGLLRLRSVLSDAAERSPGEHGP